MLEFNGKQFDVAQTMLDAAKAYVSAVMPNASQNVQDAEIEKMLGKGVSLAKKDAKAMHQNELDTAAEMVRTDPDFQLYALRVAESFQQASKVASSYADVLGFTPTPKRNGEGYHGEIPLDQFSPSALIPFAGEFDVKILLNKGAPDGADSPADFHAYVEVDLPDLDTAFQGYRENRQKAIDAATVYCKDVANWKMQLTETGEFSLLDMSTRIAGEKRGTRQNGNTMKTVQCGVNGKEYTGTARQIVSALKADGVEIPTTIINYPSHILTDKCPKSLKVSVR